MKKLWICLLVLLLLCAGAAAEGEWRYTVNPDRTVTLTEYLGRDTEVTVPRLLDGYEVSGLGPGLFPSSVKSVTVPVSVSGVADSAFSRGTLVKSRAGAPALALAGSLGLETRVISEADLSEIMVDLTGCDYVKTAEGYSLSPALAGSVRAGQGLFDPADLSGWMIEELTPLPDGRSLARGFELDTLLVFDHVIISSRGGSRDVFLGDDGRAVISWQPEREYKFTRKYKPEPLGSGPSVSSTLTISDVNIVIEMNTPALGGEPGIIIFNAYKFLEGNAEDCIDLSSALFEHVHAEFTCGYEIGFEFADGYFMGDGFWEGVGGFDLTPSGLSIPLPYGFELTPFLSMEVGGKLNCEMRTGIRGLRLGLDYTNYGGSEDLEYIYTPAEPYTETEEALTWSFDVGMGAALSLKKVVTVASLSWGLTGISKAETCTEIGYAATERCRDVTKEAYTRGVFLFNPGLDLRALANWTLKPTLYGMNGTDFGNGWSVGATFGTQTGVFVKKEFARIPIDFEFKINGHWIPSGETAHLEYNGGEWVLTERCTHMHAIAFDSGIPGAPVTTVDCSDIAPGDLKNRTYYAPDQPRMDFSGWFDADGNNFYDKINSLSGDEKYYWDGTLTLTGRWTPVESNEQTAVDNGKYSCSILPVWGPEFCDIDGTFVSDPESFYDALFETQSSALDLYVWGIPYDLIGDNGMKWEDYYAMWMQYPHHVHASSGSPLTQVVFASGIISTSGYKNAPYLATVICNDDMTGIGSYSGCTRLMNFRFPAALSSLDDYAFGDCVSLQQIDLPPTVSRIGAGAFRDCVSLQQIVLPSAVSQIGSGAFEGSGIRSLAVPGGVTGILENTFRNCTRLSQLSLPAHLDLIGNRAFENCVLLRGLDVHVSQLDKTAFNGTSGLESAVIRSDSLALTPSETNMFTGSGVKEVSFVVSGPISGSINLKNIQGLETVRITASQVSGSILIEGCPALKTVIIDSDWTGDLTVRQCPALETLLLPRIAASGRIAVSGCESLQRLLTPDSMRSLSIMACHALEYLEAGAFTGTGSGILQISNLHSLLEICFRDSVEQIPSSSISGCPRLSRISVAADTNADGLSIYGSSQNVIVRRAAVTWTEGEGYPLHFVSVYGKENEDWTVPAGESVVLFAPAARDQTTFAGWAAENGGDAVYAAGDVFVMPDHETTLYAVFEGTGWYYMITDPDHETWLWGYSRMPEQSWNICVIPGGIEKLMAGCIQYYENAVMIPAGVTEIDPCAFQNAPSLERVDVDPANPCYYSVDGVLYSADGALVYVPRKTHLRDLVIPDGVSAIAANAFHGCPSYDGDPVLLESVYVPPSVTSPAPGWTDGLEACGVYGPESGPVAESAHTAGLQYNLFPVFLVSRGELVGYLSAEAGTALDLKYYEEEGAFSGGWSTQQDGPAIMGGVTVPWGGVTLYALWGTLPAPYFADETYSLELYCAPVSGAVSDGMAMRDLLISLVLDNSEAMRPLFAASAPVWTAEDLTGGLSVYCEAGNGGTACGVRLVSAPLPGEYRLRVACAWGGQADSVMILVTFSEYPGVLPAGNSLPGVIRMVLGETRTFAVSYTPAQGVPAPASAEFILPGESGGMISCVFRDGAADITALSPGAARGRGIVGSIENLQAEKEVVFIISQTGSVTTLPEGLISIGDGAFEGAALETVVIPYGCESIGSGAFAGCARLVEISIPETVGTIAEDAFDGCGVFVINSASAAAREYAANHPGVILIGETQ